MLSLFHSSPSILGKLTAFSLSLSQMMAEAEVVEVFFDECLEERNMSHKMDHYCEVFYFLSLDFWLMLCERFWILQQPIMTLLALLEKMILLAQNP